MQLGGIRLERDLVAALAGCVLAAPAWAFQPLVSDDTGTQGAGGNQVEFAVDRERARAGAVAARTTTLPFTFTRGLSDTLDVSVGVSHVRTRDAAAGASGAGNPVMGAKWRFFEDKASETSLAIKPEVLLPVSAAGEAKGLGIGRASWGLTLIATRELGFGAVHANLGVARARFRDPATPASTITSVSIAPVWALAPGWQLALDVGVDWDRGGGVTTRTRFVGVGAVYSPSDDLDFALGVFRATDSGDPRTTSTLATAGLTWRFR